MVDLHYQNISEIPGLDSEFLFSWYTEVCIIEKKELGMVNVILVNDEEILEVNQVYLQHDYYTDIITFDYCEGDVIIGDLYISVDTVKSNSLKFGTDVSDEFKRVLVHGILHLCGYGDKTDEDEKNMRLKEDEMLNLIVSRETILTL